jgi:DNA anti-recombination protein RmuC
LIQAKINIERVKQEVNYNNIIELVEKMLDSVANLHSHADGMGKSLNSSLDKYNKFASSFNRTFLSNAKKISALGVSNKKSENVLKLKKYEIFKSED